MGVMDDYIEQAEQQGYFQEPEAKTPARPLSPAEKVMALITLARCGDDAVLAANELVTARNIHVDPGLLRQWAESEEYEAIRADYDRALDEALVRGTREAAFLADQVERQAILAVQEQLASGKARLSEVAQSARAMADVKAKNLEKHLVLTGRPTSIVESRDFDQIVGALLERGVLGILGPVVESSAVEVQDEPD